MQKRHLLSLLMPFLVISFAFPAHNGSSCNHLSGKSLPIVFVRALAIVKARSHLPMLLPSGLPEPVGDTTHAVVEKDASDQYEISLYYKLGVGDAGFAGLFFSPC